MSRVVGVYEDGDERSEPSSIALFCGQSCCKSLKTWGLLILIRLLTAIGLSTGVHIYTQTIHRTIQKKQYIEQHNNFGKVRAVPRLG
jgi:hypothetical protein